MLQVFFSGCSFICDDSFVCLFVSPNMLIVIFFYSFIFCFIHLNFIHLAIMRYMGDLSMLKNQNEVDCVYTILLVSFFFVLFC